MSASTFLNELKRRQIYRGGVMYVVAGWVIVQVASTVFPVFDIPGWTIRLVVVAIMLGFPLALVGLWMFESHAARSAPTQAAPAERRRGSDRDGAALAKLVESERAERQRANEELLAALGRMQGAPPSSHALPARSAADTPPPRRSRIGSVLLAVFVSVLAAWGIWILVAPSGAVPQVDDAGKLTQQYVLPAYRQIEQLGAALLAPLLRKLGLGIPPERAFSALMLLLALLVLRHLYRSMAHARRQQSR
ncbi:hypothetical protein [Thermomonas fusca]|uniref:Uncharacterized protein n=1 Tax=Thermomonas fusca TaxID=215690 RepID=A0A5R9PE64_9GAMM|nr:hypothetical protein [Thermomonas fusca]TLX21672.1 hypothetical protein E5S66_09125 [Thermomonas fusca]